MKKIAILQSNYIPWKGYFDIIANADVFIFLDDVQYTKNDWRNRNMIKSRQGREWLTIPIKMTGKFGQRICETEISSDHWVKKHLSTIQQNYSKSPFFADFFPELEKTYLLLSNEKHISTINQKLIGFLSQWMGIQTTLKQSTDYFSLDDLSRFTSNDRVLEICKKEQATAYISGPSAKSYIDPSAFQTAGIELLWTDYSTYPEYRQNYGAFEHAVSVIDLIFNTGQEALQHMKGPRLLSKSNV